MSRLTWQNVDAPDLGRAADILNSAAMQVGMGGNTIADAVRNVRKDQMDRRSAAALPILAGVTGAGDVQGALAQIGSTIRPEDMNEETRKAYMGLMDQALGYDSKRANTASVVGGESRAATDFSRDIARQDQEASLAGKIISRKEQIRGGVGANGLPTNDRDLLALTLAAEAGGEGYQGMLATGSVVANRVKSGKYGIGFGGVITKPGQFSYLNGVTGYADGEGAVDPSKINVPDEAYAAADAILSGNYKDPTNGATHYYNDSVSDPAWGANKAGGDWIRIGNHVFGNPDGQSGVKPGVSDLIPANNLLPLSFWDGQSNDAWAADEAGYARRRSRTADSRADQELENTKAAKELAMTATKQTERPQDLATLIGRSDAPIDVKTQALEFASSPLVQSQFGTLYDPNATALPGSADAITSLDQADTLVADQLSNNPTLRIQANAAEFDAGGGPAVELAARMGNATDEGKGWATDNINQVVSDARAEGINLSPAEAAALLNESAEYAGWTAGLFPGGEKWGNAYADPTKAVELAKTYLTTEQKRAGATTLSQLEAAKSASSALRSSMAEEARALTLAQSRGDTDAVQKFQANYDKIVERALKFERGFSIFPKPTPKSDANTTVKGKPTTTDPLQTAAAQIADGALQAATEGGIDLSGLAKASTETQVRVLKTAIENLTAKGGSPAQIAALEQLLAQANEADTKEAIIP